MHCLLLAAMAAAQVSADTTGELRGSVSDATTSAPVVGATIVVRGTRTGTAADLDGQYRLAELAPGQYSIIVGRIGYVADTSQVTIVRGAVTTHNVRLQPSTAQLETVRVAAEAPERNQFRLSPNPGTVSISGRTLGRVPVIGEPDVLRVVQLLPGVVATSDFNAGYNVRGGESDQNLVLLDGYPIYNPFHLAGLFGTFIDEAVGEFELIPGGFPARYGTRLSSVLSVSPRAEERSGVHGTATISMLASALAVGGTVRGATSWNIAARRTYADQFVSRFTDRELPYYFTDVQAHLRHRLRNGGTVSATAYWGADVFDASLATFGDSSRAGGGSLRFDWGNAVVGIAYEQPLRSLAGSDSARLMQRLSHTTFNTALDIGSGSLTFGNGIRETRAWGEVARWHGRHESLLGYELSAYGTNFKVNASAAGTGLFDAAEQPSAGSLYLDHTVRASKVSARAGVRVETVTGTGWTGVSPRLSLKYFATPDMAFTIAGGSTTQWTPALRNEQAPVRVFDFWLVANRNTPVARAWNGIVGAERWFGASGFVRVESWYKDYDRLLSSNLEGDPAVTGDEFIVTTGKSYGADLLVRQLETRKLSGWLAYGYQVSWRDGASGRFPPVQDRRHNLNLVASYRSGERWTYGARLGIGSGTPFTDIVGQVIRRRYNPVTGEFELAGGIEREPLGGARNASRFPWVQRLDLSVTRTGSGRVAFSPFVSIINAYNARNIFTYLFDYASNPPTRTAFSQFPFLPTAGVKLTW